MERVEGAIMEERRLVIFRELWCGVDDVGTGTRGSKDIPVLVQRAVSHGGRSVMARKPEVKNSE